MAYDDDSERAVPPDDTEPLLTISGFARTVGLSASALRFYADAGLVVPAEVDAYTGYRYYTPEQQRRAILVRRLRDADMPLADIRIVLGPDRDQARAVLQERLTASADRAAAARAILADVLSVIDLPDELRLDHADGAVGATPAAPSAPTSVTVAGPELASAIGQVRHAAGRRRDGTGLDGVLLDLEPPALTVVATDRYWLARRELVVVSASGPHRRMLLGLDAADDLATGCLSAAEVRLVSDDKGGRVLTGSDADGTVLAEITAATHRFPAWRVVVDQLPPAISRLLVDRADAVALLSDTRRSVVELTVNGNGGSIGAETDANGSSVPPAVHGVGTGAATTVQVSAPLLQRALAAAVGTYVVFDVAGSRSALRLSLPDQPGFVALVMPMSADT